MPGPDLLRRDERFHDQDPSWVDVHGETRDRPPELAGVTRVGDRAEKASHHLVAVTEVEVAEVALVQLHAGQAFPCDGEHFGIEVHALDLVAVAQQLQVLAGPASHVEEAVPGSTFAGPHERVEPVSLGRVVLP
jgi:hypothetical protein